MATPDFSCPVIYSVAVWLRGTRGTYTLRSYVRYRVRLYRVRRKMYCLRSKARLIEKKCFEKNKNKSQTARKKFILEELPNSSETEDMRKIR